MTSSAMTGDRRWVTGRRGGMTVLGKIAAPKPVNLPSQKLENHGLDPNVEIVPRGTIGWGTAVRSSPSGNTWGSSPALSPGIDGNSSSPSHLTSRPSSGGSGTRPSTAGSEKSLEPANTAWSSSRPSSASGGLAGNNTVATARPRSADTRPGSSQLSRFAETATDSSVPWRGQGTLEKMGTASSKTSEFMLTSGDFPTLGSDKASDLHVQQGHNTHGRPTSSSGRPCSQKGCLTEETRESKSDTTGTVNTWKRDDSIYKGGGFASPEKLLMETKHPIPYANMPAHHFDPALYPAPIPNQPEGVGYRGGPVAPYGPMGAPGGYPLDQSRYYPQMPMRVVSYPQTVPGLGPGASATVYTNTGGERPVNVECHRPLIPNSYVFPGGPLIPVRPGNYPASLPYDGYYGPRMGFHKNNEPDIPVKVTVGSPTANEGRHYGQGATPDPSKPNARSVATRELHGPASQGHNENAHSRQGPYKVLLKSRDETLEKLKEADDQRGHPLKLSNQHSGQPTTHACSVSENDWDVVASINGPMDFSKPAFSEDSLGILRHHVAVVNKRPINDSLMKKSEDSEQSASNNKPYAISKTSVSSVEKASRADAKLGVSDGHTDIQCPPKENNTEQSKIMSAKGNYSTGKPTADQTSHKGKIVSNDSREPFYVVNTSNLPGSVPSEKRTLIMESSALDKHDSSEAVGRAQGYRRGNGPNSRGDHHAQGNFNMQEGGGSRHKVLSSETSTVDASSDVYHQEHIVSHADQEKSADVPIKAESPSNIKAGGEPYVVSSMNSSDHKAQRAKMREIAAQRAKQRQEEEEERIREQKAKAFAKLEELNRRAAESSTSKPDETSREGGILKHRADFTNTNEPTRSDPGKSDKIEVCQKANMENPAIISSDCNVRQESVIHLPKEVQSEMSSCGQRSQLHGNSADTSLEGCFPELRTQGNTSQVHEIVASKQKPVGSKRKQNSVPPKSLESQSIFGEPRNDLQVTSTADGSASDNQSSTTDTKNAGDGAVPHQRKGSKGFRKKNKLDTASTVVDFTLSAAGSVNATNLSEISKAYMYDSLQEVGSVQSQGSKNISKGVEVKEVSEVVISETQKTLHASDETHGRVSHWKNKSSRRPSRGTHVESIPLTVENVSSSNPVPEISKPHISDSSQGIGSVQPQEAIAGGIKVNDVSEVVTSETQKLSHASDETHARVAHWRNQPSKRTSRGAHVVRQGEKMQGNETIWAPVHTAKQNMPSEEPIQQDVRSRTDESSAPKVHVVDTQSPSKNKRAEIQRYVPKPVAKELQHGGSQELPSSSASHLISDMSTTKTDVTQCIKKSGQHELIATKTRSGTEITNSETKHKHIKTHISWRQCASGESCSSLPSSREEPHTFARGKNIPETADIHHTSNPQQSSCSELEQHSECFVDNSSESNRPLGPGSVHDPGLHNQQVEFQSGRIKDKGKNSQLAEREGNNHTIREPKFGGSGRDDCTTVIPSVADHKSSQWQPKSHPHIKGNKTSSINVDDKKVGVHVVSIHGKQFPDQVSRNFSRQVFRGPGSQAKCYQPRPDTENARVIVHAYHHEREKERKGPNWRENRCSGELGQQQTSGQAALEQSSVISEARAERPLRTGIHRHGQQVARFHNRASGEPNDGNTWNGELGQQQTSGQAALEQSSVISEARAERPLRTGNHRHGQQVARFHNRASGEPNDGNTWNGGQDVSKEPASVAADNDIKKQFENHHGGSQKHNDAVQQDSIEIDGSQSSVGSKFSDRGGYGQGRQGARFFRRAANRVGRVAYVGDGK